MNITLQRLKNAVKDIKEDNEWVNDSHEKVYYNGLCEGLDRLLRHFKELEENEDDNQSETKKRPTWVWIYGDELLEVWEHFGFTNPDPEDRMKLKFVNYKSREVQLIEVQNG